MYIKREAQFVYIKEFTFRVTNADLLFLHKFSLKMLITLSNDEKDLVKEKLKSD